MELSSGVLGVSGGGGGGQGGCLTVVGVWRGLGFGGFGGGDLNTSAPLNR